MQVERSECVRLWHTAELPLRGLENPTYDGRARPALSVGKALERLAWEQPRALLPSRNPLRSLPDNKDVSVMMSEMDVNAIAGTLKLYFRELPEPLFTDELYPNFAEGIGAYWHRREGCWLTGLRPSGLPHPQQRSTLDGSPAVGQGMEGPLVHQLVRSLSRPGLGSPLPSNGFQAWAVPGEAPCSGVPASLPRQGLCPQ